MDMSLLGIIVALVVLIIICYRKFNPVVGTLICVAILAIFSGLSVLDTITDTYFTGFSDFLKNNFLLFATGTVFASIMEGSGAAAAFAKMIYSKVPGTPAAHSCRPGRRGCRLRRRPHRGRFPLWLCQPRQRAAHRCSGFARQPGMPR